jgi:hypothetical protein
MLALRRVAGCRLVCAPLRTGLVRRQKHTIAEIVAERYSADPKFYRFTAGVVSLAVLQRMYDSMSGGSHSHEHHSHDHAHTTHEAPAATAHQNKPEKEAPPPVVETATPPQQAAETAEPLALDPAPLRPAPAVNEKPLPIAVYEPPVLASNELALPTAVGKPVGAGNVSAFSDGANVWVVEAGLLPGAPGATRANGQWVRARQMTDFGAGEAPPLLEGISADAGWVLVTRLTGDGSQAQLLAIPAMRGRTQSGRALLAAAASPAIDLTPAPRASVDKVTMGAGGALLEVSGLAPAGAAVFRAALPAPGSGEAPGVVLDTVAPAGGELVEWLVDGENLAVRGALVLQRPANQLVLLLRAQQQASGNSLWLATCKRLGLPPPATDPNAPPAYSEWREVASWDAAAPRLVIGFRGEHAWLTDPEGHVVALNADSGEVLKLPLC